MVPFITYLAPEAITVGTVALGQQLDARGRLKVMHVVPYVRASKLPRGFFQRLDLYSIHQRIDF